LPEADFTFYNYVLSKTILQLTAQMFLVIDNFDSFTYNLVQYLGELGAAPQVFRNNAITVAQIAEMQPDGIVISPGPGRPEEAGVIIAAIQKFAGKIPLLGVCQME